MKLSDSKNEQSTQVQVSRRTDRTPSRQQVARTLDRMFRKNAEVLLQVFFDKLLEKIRAGDMMAMQQFERIYRLSQQSPAVAVQINNNIQNNVQIRSRDRRFESIIERLERRDQLRNGVLEASVQTDADSE